MKIRAATVSDVPSITAILNHEIANAPAIWLEKPVSEDSRRAWLLERQENGFPVFVAEDDGILGFGSFGPFRPYEGFRNTVEHLVYVSADARGKGVGRALLISLIDEARKRMLRVMVGAIDAENEASLKLHLSLGFVETGRMFQIGEKWGVRRTMVLLQNELQCRG